MGQKIKKILSSEKGSITMLVVAAMLFMIVILALSFMSVSNKKSAQISNIRQIEAEYESKEDIGEVYKEVIETSEIGKIRLTPSTTEWTNGDVIVTVEYEKQLTENRKAGVGSASVPNATSVTVTENATVYAEASTKEGQKRKASLEIKNIDKVKPTAVIRINGGSYVMPTKGDKATIKTRVNASDLGGSELKDLKYAWSQSKDVEPTTWQTFADGETLTKNDCTIGTYYLWLNITDHAGNRSDTRVSNAFIVRDSSNAMDNITFKIEPDGWTKDDVKVTVIYGDNLTENRKAGPEGEELKPNATIVTMTKNGKVVAEAEDPAGNKVIASIDIDKIDKVPPVIKTVTNPSNGNWTKDDTTVTLVAEDNLSGIKEFQWFEDGKWTTRALETNGNTGTITYTADRDTTIRFRVIDNAGNISEEKTTVLKIDKTAPTHTNTEVKNITTTGYDVYIYGVTDGSGSGVNRVQFPTWTDANGQDDLQANWQTSDKTAGVKQADGTTWVYRVNVTDHKNEYGEYITHIYAYDNIGNDKYATGMRVQVPGVVITFNANGGTVTEGTRTKGYASQIGTLPTPTRPGYTFTGWFTAATGGTRIADTTTVPADNVTYYAQWTRDTYTISYNLNGGTVTGNPTSYNVETETITLPTPTKTGYTFTGWTGSNGTTPQTTVTIPKGSTGNKSYTANWKTTNYTITYDLNGGTITGNPENYNIESDEITLPTPTKTGYTFAGWTGSNGTTPQTTVKIPKGQTGNKNYTANWTANNYTLAYNANGGTGSMATDTIAYNTNYTTKANAFTRTGYTFKGWNEKADGTGTDWTSWIGKPWQWTYDRNVTLYAQWTRDTYTIEYNLNGGTITGQPTSYNVESNAITLPTPTKTGYTFTGWTGSNGTTPQKTVTIAKGSTGNKNYTANWTINNYTVTYDNNYYENSIWNDTTVLSKYNSAGTAPKSRTNVADANAKDGNYIKFVMSSGTSGGPYYAPAVELTSGKTYTWSVYIKASTNKKLNMGDEQNGQKDVNVTTNWQKVTHTFTATEYSNYKAFIFYANVGWTDGEELYVHSLEIMEGTPTHTTASKQYNSTLGTLPAPTRTGYTFTGWYTEPVGGTKISDTTTVPANNVTYYAHWTTNTYTIGYNLNGGTANGPTSFNVGTETITLPTPTKNGYTFTGWTGSNGTTPQTTVTIPKGSTGDKSYTANWTATNYTISYNLNGGTISGQPTSYNIESNEITLPTPTKTGYTFTGWTGSNGTTPQTTVTIPKGSTENRNYTANWSINSYHIDLNYTVDGTAYWSGYNSRIYVGLKVGGADKGYVQDYGGDHNYGTTWEIYGLKLDGVNVAYTASGTLGAGDLSLMRYFYTITINRNNTNYGIVSSSSVIVPNNSTTYSTTGNTLKLSDGRTVTATATAATGYTTTFSSWTPTSGTVNAATTVTANFTRTANPYTVTYNYAENGGKSATKTSATVNYGSAIDLSPTAVKDGYTFVGWNTNKDATTKLNSLNMGAGNVTLYAIYSKTLTGTFYYWDGSKTANKTASVTIYNKQTSGTITAPSVNAISGYTARGWSTSSAANATVISGNLTLSSDTNYYMSYSYGVTLTYNGNGTTTGVPAAQSGTAYMNYKGEKVGATITLSTTKPTRTNYTFSGWYTATSGGTKYETSTTINANTTIYAQWSGNVYKVTLNTQNATSAGSTAVYEKYGTGIYKELACTNQMTTSANAITKPSRSYTLTYNANGGTVSGTSTTASYTFGGYYTATGGSGDQLINANGNITSAFSTTKYSANGTLYAKWTRNDISLATPTRAGYIFKGWFTAASGGSQITSATSITSDQTIYAQWQQGSYTVNFDLNTMNDMNKWSFIYRERFNISYDSATKLNNISVAGDSGWEIAYIPISTVAGKEYTISFDYQNPNGYTALSGYQGIGYQVLSKVENLDNMANSIATKYLTTTASGITRLSITFKATSTTTYFAYNFGMANDGVTTTVKLGNLKVSETIAYNTELGSLPTPAIPGFTFNGWFTAATGGTKVESTLKVTAEATYYAQGTVNNYTQTVQVRYENVDGTFTGYSNAINTSYAYGSTVSWSRAADATYQAASITSYTVIGAKTTQVTVYRQKYYLDLNGYLDGTSGGNLGVYGKADVYVNGSRVSAGVTDFYQQYRAGTTYEIKNIVANNGYVYEGVYSGSISGTITKATGVWLKFVKRDTLKFTNVTRDGFTIEYYSADNITGARQAAVWTSSNGQDDIVWHGLDNNGGGKWSKRIYVSGHKYEYGEYIAHIYDNPAASMRIAGTVNVPFEERIYIYGVDSTGYKVRIYTNRSGVTKVQVPTWTTNNGQDDIEWITATSQGYGAYLATVKVSNHNYENGEYNSHVYLTINGSQVGVASLIANVTGVNVPAHTCNANDYCTTVHTYPYAQYNYYWSSCGEWHNTCRHAICSVCGSKYTTGNLAKCPNNPPGNAKPCPTPGTY